LCPTDPSKFVNNASVEHLHLFVQCLFLSDKQKELRVEAFATHPFNELSDEWNFLPDGSVTHHPSFEDINIPDHLKEWSEKPDLCL